MFENTASSRRCELSRGAYIALRNVGVPRFELPPLPPPRRGEEMGASAKSLATSRRRLLISVIAYTKACPVYTGYEDGVTQIFLKFKFSLI